MKVRGAEAGGAVGEVCERLAQMKVFEEARAMLLRLDEELQRSSTPFFCGAAAPTAADLTLYGMLERWIGDGLCPARHGAAQPSIADGMSGVQAFWEAMRERFRPDLVLDDHKECNDVKSPVGPETWISRAQPPAPPAAAGRERGGSSGSAASAERWASRPHKYPSTAEVLQATDEAQLACTDSDGLCACVLPEGEFVLTYGEPAAKVVAPFEHPFCVLADAGECPQVFRFQLVRQRFPVEVLLRTRLGRRVPQCAFAAAAGPSQDGGGEASSEGAVASGSTSVHGAATMTLPVGDWM
ncbi:unnamed protein product, partial [Prorocentrum cordatum]